MPTTTVDVEQLSALYDRIYDIADRLFKKYNPCNIQVKDNKTKCISRRYKCNYLCCTYYDGQCEHWENGCTVKCLACKLFVCAELLYEYDKNGVQMINKKYRFFVNKVKRLQRIASGHNLSCRDYHMPKEKALQHAIKQIGWRN